MPDSKWLEMKVIWDACEKAGINPPNEVNRYFDGCPDESKMVMSLESLNHYDIAMEPIDRHDKNSGFIIHLDKIPENVTQIRIESGVRRAF